MAHVWADEPFDETADLSLVIRAALDAEDPAAILQTAFPWVPSDARRRFTLLATTREEDLDTLILRYEHTVKAYWANRYMGGDPTPRPPSRWSRLFKRGEQ